MDRIDRYIDEYSSAGTQSEMALLAELDRVTNLRVIQPKMVSGRIQGAFLRLLTEMLQPRLVLEIGTFTGYSALAMAAGMEGEQGATANQVTELHTIEIDDELEDLAREFFARSPHGHKIHLHIGSALKVAPRLAREKGPFDLIYIDGDKREYPDYYRMLWGRNADGGKISSPLVKSGSIILADNVLWYGKVADSDPSKSLDRHTEGIREFNRLVVEDPCVENVILPLRDGISLIRVK